MNLETLTIGLAIALFFSLWTIRILGDKYYRSGRSKSSDEGVAADPDGARPDEWAHRNYQLSTRTEPKLHI